MKASVAAPPVIHENSLKTPSRIVGSFEGGNWGYDLGGTGGVTWAYGS